MARGRLCGLAVGVAVAVAVAVASAPARAGDGGWKRLLRSGVDKYRAFDYAAAAEDLRGGLAEATAAGDEKGAALVRRALGDVLVVLGRDAEAEEAYRRLLDWEQRRHPAADPSLNPTRWMLYAVETALGRHEAGGAIFKQIADESPRPVAPTLVLVDASDINKVTLLSAFPLKYAEPLARRVLRIHERVYGADRAAAPLARLASVLRELHRDEEAQRLEARARMASSPASPGGR